MLSGIGSIARGAASMVGYGGGSVVVEQAVASSTASALAVATVVSEAQDLEGDFEIFGDLDLDDNEQDLIDTLDELRENVAMGAKANELILDQLKHMQERIEVLEANTFVEAAKWIFEKICELFCKIQKVMVDIGENMPLIGGKASRAGEFNDLDKLLEKETQRIDKLAGKNELGDNKAQYDALKANAKLDHKARQDDLHAKHEQQVDAKYGKGNYKAEQAAKKAGIEVTPQQKEAIWKADATCKYNKIDQKQQAHVKQRKVHGAILAKKYPELQKAGQYVGKKAGEAGKYVGEKASAAKKAVGGRFAEMVAKRQAPATGAQR